MKRVLSVLLAVIVLASLLAVPVLAEGQTTYPSREVPPDVPSDDNPVGPPTGYESDAAVAVMAIALTIGTAAVVVTGRKYFSAK